MATDNARVTITPIELEPGKNQLTAQMELDPNRGFEKGDSISFGEDAHILITGNEGARQFDFPAGQPLVPTVIHLAAKGNIGQWPFDRYTSETYIMPYRVTRATAQTLSAEIVVSGSVPGWHLELDTVGEIATTSPRRAGVSRLGCGNAFRHHPAPNFSAGLTADRILDRLSSRVMGDSRARNRFGYCRNGLVSLERPNRAVGDSG